MKQAVILDPAHGKNTPGKRSPDGEHREYIWSRERIINIVNSILKKKTLGFDLFYPFLYNENEPGLTNRVIKYNDIASNYDKTFVLSLHNDAFGNDWSKPNGISVWTSRGDDDSDLIATDLFQFLKTRYPNDHFRSANWLSGKEKTSDPDWESNFTVLYGNKKIKANYDAVLLEWRFQTNKQDVEKLRNPIHNEYFEDMITMWLIDKFK